jgi:uncharacterized phiE125 gp8 family phage protein
MATALATLAQVKEYIGNSADNTDDALLTRLITAVSELIERSSQRVFGQATYTETRNGTGGRFLVLNNRPVTAVSSLTINGITIPQSTSFTVDGWVVESPWKVTLRGYSHRFDEGVQNVQITYTAGYATVPADVAQACCLMVGLFYKERDRMGISNKTVGGENISFTKDDMPPSVMQTVRNYSTYQLA